MHRQWSRGGASILIVVFTTLMLTVITTGFVQAMMRHQQQATNADLSQSAYDSAMAGVEDAKRALVALNSCNGDTSSSCNNLRALFAGGVNAASGRNCEFLEDAGVANFGSEHEVQVGEPDRNQAYTCVKVNTESESVEGTLADTTGSKLVPLRAKPGESFDSVRVSWYLKKAGNRGDREAVSVPPSMAPSLPQQWVAGAPPVLRAQWINAGKSGDEIDLGRFDSADGSRSLFLRPTTSAGTSFNFNLDMRGSPSDAQPVQCRTGAALAAGAYSCVATIALPAGVDDLQYLNLSSIYDGTHFKVELLRGGSVVVFDNVQPSVDSTGRASDLFRRVRAKVSIGADSPVVPDAALHVDGNICKDFAVTNSASEYVPGVCNPAAL